MTYEIFKNDLREAFENSGYEVRETTVRKNNTTLDAFSIKSGSGSAICPTIYPEKLFGSDTVEEVVNRVVKGIKSEEHLKFSLPKRKEEWLERIIPHLVFIRGNEDMLETLVHYKWLDFAVCFKYVFNEDDTSDMASITINKSLSEKFGLTLEDMLAVHKENGKKICPLNLKNMSEVLLSFGMSTPVELTEFPLVLSNRQAINGSSAILYATEKLNDIADKVGCDLFLLPSSIHEWLIFPSSGMDPMDLSQMVEEVNHIEVAPEERLSNTIYRYDRKTQQIVIDTKNTNPL